MRKEQENRDLRAQGYAPYRRILTKDYRRRQRQGQGNTPDTSTQESA